MIRLSVTGVVLFGLAACLAGSHIGAFEATEGATDEKAPLRKFTTPRAVRPEAECLNEKDVIGGSM